MWHNLVRPKQEQDDPLGILSDESPNSDPLGILEKKSGGENGQTNVKPFSPFSAPTTLPSQENGKPITSTSSTEAPPPEQFDPMKFLENDIQNTGAKINPGFDAGMQLADYHAQRTKQLTTQKNILQSEVSNIHQDINVQRGDMPAPHLYKPLVPEEKKDAVDELNNQISSVDEYKNKFDNSVKHAASLYAASQTKDPVKAGRTVRTILGDKTAIEEQNYEEKGYPIAPAKKYYNELQGLDALSTALETKYPDKTDPEYIAQKAQIETESANLLNKYPEFKQRQIAKVVAQQVMQDHPNATGMATLPYIKETIKKLNLPEEDIKSIDYDEIPLQSVGSSAFGAVWNSALKLGAGAVRFAASRFIDPDYLNSHLGETLRQGEERFEDVSGMQGAPTVVDSNPRSNTYLQDISNPDKGKYNYNFHTIANAVGSGIGQLVGIVGGTKLAGGVAKSIIPGLTEAASADAGMAATMIGLGYEPYYQQAREVISDRPEDEFKRHVFALLKGSLDYAVFKPLGKLQEAISPTASRELGAILKDAPSIADVNKKLLTNWTTKVLKGTETTAGETAKIGGAQILGDISKNIVDNVLGTGEAGKKSDKELGEHILTGLSDLPFTMMIPLGIGEFAKGLRHSYTFNENVYNAGLHPETYLGQANDLLQKKVVTQDEYNARAQVINTAKDVVGSIPEDLNLNHNQKVKYVNSKLKEIAMQAKADKIGDKGLEAYYNSKIKEETDKRVSIMNGGGKSSDLEPATEGEPQPDQITKPIELNPTITNNAIGLSHGDWLDRNKDQFTAEQYKKLHEGLLSSDETVKNNAIEEIVAKKEELKTAPLPEINAIKNNDGTITVKNKEKNINVVFANESEANDYAAKNDLILNYGEKKPIAETPPQETEYKSSAEADKLLGEKIPWGKKYNNTVEYKDITTGETKTAKTHAAKDEMEKRYKSLQSLIVNCLT